MIATCRTGLGVHKNERTHSYFVCKSGSSILPETLSGNLSVLSNDAGLNAADLLPHPPAAAPLCHPAWRGCQCSAGWAGEGIQPDASSCSTDCCLHRRNTWGGTEAGMKAVGETVEKPFQKPSSPPLPLPLLAFCQTVWPSPQAVLGAPKPRRAAGTHLHHRSG